ncbi:MAG: hypothetical protein CMJ58_10005 [Planctomycetaceae bacterium]|nr:hypothetical protein [Planctomycetaceae bacterium]
MHAKNLVAAALLLFVAASVVILLGREMRESDGGGSAPAAEALPADGVVVYYFHGETRCPTCRDIENYSHAAVQTAFSKELASDKVLWKVVNYEQPENSHFATDYEIVAPTVVLVRRIGGQNGEWRNLSRVWELVGDRDAFTEYLQNETRSMLGS